MNLWLTLDAGTFQEVVLSPNGVRLILSPADSHTPSALLRVEQPGEVQGVGSFTPQGRYETRRGALVIPLGAGTAEVKLQSPSRGA